MSDFLILSRKGDPEVGYWHYLDTSFEDYTNPTQIELEMFLLETGYEFAKYYGVSPERKCCGRGTFHVKGHGEDVYLLVYEDCFK